MASEMEPKTLSVGVVQEELSHCELSDCKRDDKGQLVFHSGIYEWTDGTYRHEPDPKWEWVHAPR